MVGSRTGYSNALFERLQQCAVWAFRENNCKTPVSPRQSSLLGIQLQHSDNARLWQKHLRSTSHSVLAAGQQSLDVHDWSIVLSWFQGHHLAQPGYILDLLFSCPSKVTMIGIILSANSNKNDQMSLIISCSPGSGCCACISWSKHFKVTAGDSSPSCQLQLIRSTIHVSAPPGILRVWSIKNLDVGFDVRLIVNKGSVW